MRKNRERAISALPPEGARRPGWAAAGLIVLLANNLSQAQNSQFLFDGPGNLLVEKTESLAPPQIVGQPQMQVVQPGAIATFSVVALDTSSLSYQWLFNGTNLTGQTGDALQISNVSSNNEGYYSVLLANASGSVTSSPAPLWIDSRGCGMPDWWQLQYFSNLNQNATADFDGDGVSNLQEFLDGTNPTNSASVAYHLTLFSDGGLVQVVPSQSSYSNGAVVTLTATAIVPGSFHAWVGDVISRSNTVSLVMTTNKTVFARFTPIDFSWTNSSSGDWSVASNWEPPLVPLANDNVSITRSVGVIQSNAAECLGLVLGQNGSTPFLSLSNTFTVHGPAFWGSGQLRGGGRLLVDTPVLLLITNSVNLNACTLENGGTIFLTGTGNLGGNGGTITNRAGALFEERDLATLWNLAGSYHFDNAGIFRKSINPGTNSISIPFNNYGTLDIAAGTLVWASTFTNTGSLTLAPSTTSRFSVSAAFSNGPFNVPAGALVEMNSGTLTLAPGAQFNGSGLYRLDGGSLLANTDLLVSNLDLANVSLDGSGTVVINNVMNWTAGNMTGSGRTIIPPGATLNVSNPANINLSRTLENGGTIFWSGAGNFTLGSGVLTNRPGALFEQQGGGSFANFNSPYRFDNAGTYRKTLDPGTNSARINFNNYGVVDIEAGTMSWNLTLTNVGMVTQAPATTNRLAVSSAFSSGPFNVPAGALLELNSGTLTLAAGAQLNGSGLYRINTGTMLANTDLSVSNLDLANVALDGSGAVTVNHAMNWTAGNMTGSGRTIIPPGATLNVSNPANINLSRTLENGGTIFWSGAGNFTLSSGVLTNRPGALFEQQGAGSFVNFNSPYRFDNAGIYRKTLDPGTNNARINLNNYGTLDIRAGTVSWNLTLTNLGTLALQPGTTNRFSVSSALSSGPFNAPAGALVEFNSGVVTLVPGAQLNGGGLYRVNGGTLLANTDLSVSNLDLGTVALDGSGTVAVNNAMNWTAGNMLGNGRTIISPGATLALANISSITVSRTLENGGTVLWTGAGNLTLSGGVITNRPGGVFTVQNAATVSPFNTPYRFDNAGVFSKTLNTGTATVGVPFTNYGTVDLQSGILAANSGFVFSSNALLNCTLGGSVPGTNYGQLRVAGAVTLNGALSVALTNGFLPATNDIFTVLTAGTRNGTFATFSYPSNTLTLQLSNTPNSVLVRVMGVAVPPPLLLTPALLGTNVLLTWTAFSNVTYRVEFNPNLVPSNWNALAGDVLSTGANASKVDPLTSSNRFYRVRALP